MRNRSLRTDERPGESMAVDHSSVRHCVIEQARPLDPPLEGLTSAPIGDGHLWCHRRWLGTYTPSRVHQRGGAPAEPTETGGAGHADHGCGVVRVAVARARPQRPPGPTSSSSPSAATPASPPGSPPSKASRKGSARRSAYGALPTQDAAYRAVGRRLSPALIRSPSWSFGLAV